MTEFAGERRIAWRCCSELIPGRHGESDAAPAVDLRSHVAYADVAAHADSVRRVVRSIATEAQHRVGRVGDFRDVENLRSDEATFDVVGALA